MGYSQINCELVLLKLATMTVSYCYYHLLSGEDLTIKSQNYIHSFFCKNNSAEFVRVEKRVFSYENRVRYYYPF